MRIMNSRVGQWMAFLPKGRLEELGLGDVAEDLIKRGILTVTKYISNMRLPSLTEELKSGGKNRE